MAVKQIHCFEYEKNVDKMHSLTWGLKNINFIDNTSLPIHRWFRFPAGFSAEWVKKVIKWCLMQNKWSIDDVTVLDPFAGSGTTILAAEELGVKAYGVEAHPFLAKIAAIKLSWKNADPRKLEKLVMEVLNTAKSKNWDLMEYPDLIKRMYPIDVLKDLNSLKLAWEFHNDNSTESKIVWLAITAILRQTSNRGTAPWQYALPKKKRKKFMLPHEAFQKQISLMVRDVQHFNRKARPTGEIIRDDIRYTDKIPPNSISLVITSPPYANNYDYADAVRLELSFWGEVNKWRDLQEKVRKYLIRSCTQHVSYENVNLEELLESLKQTPVYKDIRDTCNKLAKERLRRGGKKQYHLMIAAYFSDLYLAWKNLRHTCKKECIVAFVVGDSAPYGVYVPVDDWLGKLAISSGFRTYYFDKIRDRNVKWINRKHKVPLKEGILWVR